MNKNKSANYFVGFNIFQGLKLLFDCTPVSSNIFSKVLASGEFNH